MKTVTPTQLLNAYNDLNPQEHVCNSPKDSASVREDVERIFQNWLRRYHDHPELALSVVKTSWSGKLTTALFKALGIKRPKTKSAMLRALMEMHDIVGQYCFPTGIVYADKTREDSSTHDYKRLGYLNYETLILQLEPDCKDGLAEYVTSEAAKIQAMKGQAFSIAGNMQVILGSGAAA
jgi:hypothetical protein